MNDKPLECRCPRCGKLLGKLRMPSPCMVVLEAYCKGCKGIVAVAIERKAAA